MKNLFIRFDGEEKGQDRIGDVALSSNIASQLDRGDEVRRGTDTTSGDWRPFSFLCSELRGGIGSSMMLAGLALRGNENGSGQEQTFHLARARQRDGKRADLAPTVSGSFAASGSIQSSTPALPTWVFSWYGCC